MVSKCRVAWRHVKRASAKPWTRAFSSSQCWEDEKKPIVCELGCNHHKDWKWKEWFHPDEFAARVRFLHEVPTGHLIRLSDLQGEPKLELAPLALMALRQATRLISVNLMRRRNVSHVFIKDLICISEDGDVRLMLDDLDSAIDKFEKSGVEYNNLGYKSVHDLFFGQSGSSGLFGISSGGVLRDEDTPVLLNNLRTLLKDSASVDKRLITNHPAILFPDEVSNLVIACCRFLQEEGRSLPKGHPRKSNAWNILINLGKLLAPQGIAGMHPMTDFWLDHAKNLGQHIRVVQGADSKLQPVAQKDRGRSPDHYKNGLNIVTVKRAGLLHPYGPYLARRNKEDEGCSDEELNGIIPISGFVSFKEVEHLIHFKVPMFPADVMRLFLKYKLGDETGLFKSLRNDQGEGFIEQPEGSEHDLDGDTELFTENEGILRFSQFTGDFKGRHGQ